MDFIIAAPNWSPVRVRARETVPTLVLVPCRALGTWVFPSRLNSTVSACSSSRVVSSFHRGFGIFRPTR